MSYTEKEKRELPDSVNKRITLLANQFTIMIHNDSVISDELREPRVKKNSEVIKSFILENTHINKVTNKHINDLISLIENKSEHFSIQGDHEKLTFSTKLEDIYKCLSESKKKGIGE